MLKQVKLISTAEKINMDGHLILQALPIHEMEEADPILLIHHWKSEIPPESRIRELGVGPHPHRGFSLVTFMFDGSIEHRDSRGNQGIVGAGGTQWMHAGMGIMHSERPPRDLADKGGMMELLQFWVNVPSNQKMIQPYYLNLDRQATPVIRSEAGHLELLVVAGNVAEISGPARTLSAITALQIWSAAPDQVEFSVPSGHQLLFYALDGLYKVNGKIIGPTQVARLSIDGEMIDIEALEKGKAVLVGGKPIGEPVNKYGPFVMTNQTEVLEAMRDYQMGKMGILIEEF